jgi:UDP-N-acetylmuramoylalanine--D-glutamate ligase
VFDIGAISEKFKVSLVDLEVNWEENKHSVDELLRADLIVKSPGISPKVAAVVAAREAGIKVISEIEFAGYYSTAKTICITGSNGKTTSALLTHHILKNAGLNVGLAGNIGDSYAKQVAENAYDWFVLELSSFQLDDMYEFKADIAVLLNITPDHLDRYDNKMENYSASKFRIIQNQTQDDWFIYNFDDPIISSYVNTSDIKAKKAPFSLTKEFDQGGYLNDNQQIIINTNKQQFTMSIHDLALKGKHNA